MARPTNVERGVIGTNNNTCNLTLHGLSPVELYHARALARDAGINLSEEIIKFIRNFIGMEDVVSTIMKKNHEKYLEIEKIYLDKLSKNAKSNEEVKEKERESKEKEFDILKTKLTPVISSMMGTVCRFGKKSIEYQQVLGEVRYYAKNNSLRTPTDAEMESIIDELLVNMNQDTNSCSES